MAVTLTSIRQLIPRQLSLLPYLLVTIFAILSISRGYSVFIHYRGVAETHKQLHDYLIFTPDANFSQMNVSFGIPKRNWKGMKNLHKF